MQQWSVTQSGLYKSDDGKECATCVAKGKYSSNTTTVQSLPDGFAVNHTQEWAHHLMIWTDGHDYLDAQSTVSDIITWKLLTALRSSDAFQHSPAPRLLDERLDLRCGQGRVHQHLPRTGIDADRFHFCRKGASDTGPGRNLDMNHSN